MEQLLSVLSPVEWIIASVVLGAIFFVVGLIGLPFDEKTHLGRRVFWSFVLLLAELTLGFMISLAASLQETLADINQQIDNEQRALSAALQFEPVLTAYEVHFTDVKEPLESWASSLKKYLGDEFTDGFIPVTKEAAPAELARAYEFAQKYVIAVNVGSTSFYFGKTPAAKSYVTYNRLAMSKGIPIIRFYVYKTGPAIELSNGKPAGNFQTFADDVIHNVAPATGALYSAVIDIDSPTLNEAPRDILLIDSDFLAETQLADDWSVIRAVATADHKNIDKVTSFLSDLDARQDPSLVYKLSDHDIQTKFSVIYNQYHRFTPGSGQELAGCIYQDVMRNAQVLDTVNCTEN